jgi:hypothetical protein
MTNKERQRERDRGRYPDGKTQNEERIEGRRRRDYRKNGKLFADALIAIFRKL